MVCGLHPYAIRKPKGYEVTQPGDLVQLDTLDIRPLPGVVLKHFTAQDIISRWDVLEVYARSTAPPRSPELNGYVERAQRTHTEEFYEVTDSSFDLAELRDELSRWQAIYNRVRPRQSLGYLTPLKFLERWKQYQREEVKCH